MTVFDNSRLLMQSSLTDGERIVIDGTWCAPRASVSALLNLSAWEISMKSTTVVWLTAVAFAAGGFVGSALNHQSQRNSPYPTNVEIMRPAVSEPLPLTTKLEVVATSRDGEYIPIKPSVDSVGLWKIVIGYGDTQKVFYAQVK